MEGPEENAERVLELVKLNMEKPFLEDMLVKMEVDAKICDNWYEGK